MCGLTGFLNLGKDHMDKNRTLSVLENMTSQIISRGPDDYGVWSDEDNNIALGFRRLSIQDISTAGHQPMVSPCERYVLTFNGEIYNFNDLRSELKKTDWQGHSDTEVLLTYIVEHGFEKTLLRLNGMFAIALWDKREKQLLLARDRLG